MEVSKEELKEIKEYVENIKGKIEVILDKEIETLTEEDLKELYYFKNTFKSHQTKISLFQREIDTARKEIDQKIKKYTLLERSEIVSEDEEKQLEETQILIDEAKKEIEEKGLYDLLDRVEKKEVGHIQYEEWKIKVDRRKEIEDRKAEIKEAILSKDDNSKYYYKLVKTPFKDGRNKWNFEIELEPVSEKIMKLIKEYNAFEREEEYCFTIGQHYDTEHYYKNIYFKPYEECNLDGKQALKEKEFSDKKRIEEILLDETGKYDKKGKISIPIYEKNTKNYCRTSKELDKLEIEITPRELAEYGILPEDLKWKSLEEISKEENKGKILKGDIASASKGLTTKDVKGAKGVFINLLEKVKNIFKGKE